MIVSKNNSHATYNTHEIICGADVAAANLNIYKNESAFMNEKPSLSEAEERRTHVAHKAHIRRELGDH